MAKNNEKYAYLNQLSTEQLEELLRMDMEASRSGNEDVIFHILEVIEQRENEHPTGCIPDVDKAWAEFQEYYDVPEGADISLYPCEIEPDGNSNNTDNLYLRYSPRKPCLRRWLKQSLIALIAVAAIFGGMLVAQAAGIDVLGAIGHWSDETFQFVFTGSKESSTYGANAEYYKEVERTLHEWGVDEDLFPTWQPEGFVAQEPQIESLNSSETISVTFEGNDRLYSVWISRYYVPVESTGDFEKDAGFVEEYVHNGDLFYIFSNIDTVTATCYSGQFMTMIGGTLTIDEVKAIIDSIGGK